MKFFSRFLNRYHDVTEYLYDQGQIKCKLLLVNTNKRLVQNYLYKNDWLLFYISEWYKEERAGKVVGAGKDGRWELHQPSFKLLGGEGINYWLVIAWDSFYCNVIVNIYIWMVLFSYTIWTVFIIVYDSM